MQKTRIYIALPQDRDAVVAALARNDYTVRQGKEKKGRVYIKFVEFWKKETDARSEKIGNPL